MILSIFVKTLVVIIAALHLYFFYFEMFAWTTTGKKIFGRRREGFYEETKSLAANQGLYNGFLVAGLIWSLFIQDENWFNYVSLFFLSCVLVAGIYGGISASRKIFLVQGLPALFCMVLIIIQKLI